MLSTLLIFAAALAALLISARFFTDAAENLGKWLQLPAFVIGVFIVGIGTSLPELVSGILSVQQGVSEIVPGNIIGSNISNLLLVTGLAIALNRKHISLGSGYIYIDLHFLLGSFFIFSLIAFDGHIDFKEAWIGIAAFLVYSFYLIKDATKDEKPNATAERGAFPVKSMVILLVSAVGIYFGADYTIQSVTELATAFSIPKSIIALTVLSLGTTLPELAVNITAIRQGKAEIAVGNVLGSCVFNTLVIPGVASSFGAITVTPELLSFSLPVMAAAGLFFYLLSQDKRISPWEGLLFVMIYILFMLETIG